QAVHVAGGVRLARHGDKNLSETAYYLSGVVKQSRAGIEVRNRSRRQKMADHQGIGLEAQTRRYDHDERNPAVVRHLLKGGTIDVLEGKMNGQEMQSDHTSNHRRNQR